MALAIFDLDETLIGIDSDHAWGDFVADRKLVDPDQHRALNAAFYEDYKAGRLDVDAYYKFSCSVLAARPLPDLLSLRAEFIDEKIRPQILPRALELIESHRTRGDSLLVVTATIEFITAPIVALFGITQLIAPMPEMSDGSYTGNISGVPSFREGKVTRIHQWLAQTGESLVDSYCYSDSRNDLPMLELADHPTAVDPDPRLREIAKARKWPIISLRD
ncbi:MAG: HAD family hydrolase [Pseudomonadota bacterium]